MEKQLIKNDIKILGIWFGKNQLNKHWQPIIGTISNTLKCWKNRNLSIKSKIQVINTYVLSKAWYIARICLPNQEIINKINKLLYNFIWDGKPELIARNTLSLEYKEGGIKIPDFEIKIDNATSKT